MMRLTCKIESMAIARAGQDILKEITGRGLLPKNVESFNFLCFTLKDFISVIQ